MYIYLLKRDDVVVYVGKTNDLTRRIHEHKGKKFNDYLYIKCPEYVSSEVEDMLIMLHDPIYNHSLNSRGEYKNINLFCEMEEIDIGVARKVINETPYIEPIFNDNYSPHSLSALKALCRGVSHEQC